MGVQQKRNNNQFRTVPSQQCIATEPRVQRKRKTTLTTDHLRHYADIQTTNTHAGHHAHVTNADARRKYSLDSNRGRAVQSMVSCKGIG